MKTWQDFLTSKARLAFIKLKQAFIEILIFHYFDSKYYIRIEINIFRYAMGRILSQLTLDNLE